MIIRCKGWGAPTAGPRFMRREAGRPRPGRRGKLCDGRSRPTRPDLIGPKKPSQSRSSSSSNLGPAEEGNAIIFRLMSAVGFRRRHSILSLRLPRPGSAEGDQLRMQVEAFRPRSPATRHLTRPMRKRLAVGYRRTAGEVVPASRLVENDPTACFARAGQTHEQSPGVPAIAAESESVSRMPTHDGTYLAGSNAL
jgi:hypothetical protein